MKWIAEHKWGIWAFAVAVAFIPGIMSSAFLPRWAVIVVGAPLVSQLRISHLSQAMQYVIVLGLSYAACSVLVSPDRMSGALHFFFMLAMVGVFIAASELESLDDAMTGLALGVGVSSLVSLLWLADVHVVSQAANNTKPAGLFYNSEVLAEFAAPVFLWTVLKKRWWLAVPAVVPMLVCNSRIAIFAVVAGAVYAFGPVSRVRMAALFIALFSAVGAAIVLLAVFGGYKLDSAGTRVVIWLATLLAATPLGNGLGWFEAAHPPEQFAHSDAIQAINELGIGSLFLAAIPFLILRGNRGTNVERAVFVTICTQVLVSFPLQVPGAAFVAALVAGYLAGDRAPVLLRRFECRTGITQNHEWYSAVSRTINGGSRSGRRAVPIRSEFAPHAAMG